MDYALWAVAVLALLVALKASLMAAAAGRDADEARDSAQKLRRALEHTNASLAFWTDYVARAKSSLEALDCNADFKMRCLAAALGYKWTPEGNTEARWEKVGKR